MIDGNALEKLPNDALLHVFMGACFLYSHNHEEPTREDMYQLKTEILRRLNN